MSMYYWEKLGLLFNPADYPGREWMDSFAQAPATLVLDNVVRVFFSCRPMPDSSGMYCSYSAWVDLDRSDLFKVVDIAIQPVLELGDVGTFDEFGTYPFSVVPDGDTYLGYFGGWTRCESVPFNVSIGVARSQDGKVFHRLGPGPVLSHSVDEPFILSGPKIRRFGDLFNLFYIAGTEWVHSPDGKPEPVYKIRMATSSDGITWEKHGRYLIEDKLGVHEAQASPDVIFSNGRYHMFFCYRQALDYRHNKDKSYRIGYAWSENLFTWHRDDDQSDLDVSPEGWDSEMVAYPHVLELDGETYLFYLGNQVGREGFGVARLKGTL